MTTENPQKPTQETTSGWTVFPKETPPKPGVWPAMLALGITFLVWGLVTSLIISGIGALLFTLALTGWVRDIRHERSKH